MIDIDKILFGFTAHDKPFVYGLYADWDEFCQNTIEPIIDEVLSEFDDDDVKRCVERLELNIGSIREESFFEDFPVRFKEEFIRVAKAVFENRAQKQGQLSFNGSRSMQIEDRLSNAVHYLTCGTWPEQCNGNDIRLKTELEDLLECNEESIVRLIQESLNKRVLLERIILHLDNKTLGRLLIAWLDSTELRQDEKQKAISLLGEEYPYLLLLLLKKVHQGGLELSGLIKLVKWEDLDYSLIPLSSSQIEVLQDIMVLLPEAINTRWKAGIEYFGDNDNKQRGVKGALKFESGVYLWMADENIDVAEKRRRIMELTHGEPSGLIKFVNAIEQLQQAKLFVEIMNEDSILEMVDFFCEHKETMRTTKCWMYICDWFLTNMEASVNEKELNIMPLVMDEAAQAGQDEFGREPKRVLLMQNMLMSDYISINNAGLVLLTPWFPRLFAMLGLLNDEGKDFRDTDSRRRAVFIIQRMVTFEEQDYMMPDLIFNRILVGLPLNEALPSRVQLTDEEIGAVDSMLEGVKGNWSQMANTSVKGFQHSFVERKGMLEMQEERILLTVEPRSYDLLLDSLPWGYKLVRFPWLEKRVQVSWRDKE